MVRETLANDHVQYRLRLCELELIERERRIKVAKFSAIRMMDSFDFKVNLSLNKALTMQLVPPS